MFTGVGHFLVMDRGDPYSEFGSRCGGESFGGVDVWVVEPGDDIVVYELCKSLCGDLGGRIDELGGGIVDPFDGRLRAVSIVFGGESYEL